MGCAPHREFAAKAREVKLLDPAISTERKPFSRIVFPVDFSERVKAIAPCVRLWARRFDSHITVLHVFDLVHDHHLEPSLDPECGSSVGEIPYTPALREIRDSRQGHLEKFARDRFAGLDYITLVEDGDTARLIDWVVRRESADLVIMPSKGLGKFRRLLGGSITERVLHDVSCPVLTSSPLAESGEIGERGYRSIVCAVEVDREADRVLKVAGFLAREFGAKLSVVHTEPPAIPAEQEAADADLLREKVRQDFETGEVKVRVLDSTVEQGIRFAATVEKADLVVVGRGHEAEFFGRIWSHLYAIIRESPCPVLSV